MMTTPDAYYQAAKTAIKARGGCFVVMPRTPEWHAWRGYLIGNELRQQCTTMDRILAGSWPADGFAAPAQWPWEFDAAWSREDSATYYRAEHTPEQNGRKAPTDAERARVQRVLDKLHEDLWKPEATANVT